MLRFKRQYLHLFIISNEHSLRIKFKVLSKSNEPSLRKRNILAVRKTEAFIEQNFRFLLKDHLADREHFILLFRIFGRIIFLSMRLELPWVLLGHSDIAISVSSVSTH